MRARFSLLAVLSYLVIEPPRLSLPTPTAAPTASVLAPVEACARVRAEARRCVALVGNSEGHVATLGLDSGTACLGPALDLNLANVSPSMGRIGDRLYVCADERRIVEIDLADGALRTAPNACAAITNMDNELLIQPELRTMLNTMIRPHLDRYASFDAVRASRSTGRRLALGASSTIAVRDGVGYFARGTADEVFAMPFRPYAQVTNVPLERFNDAVHGLDVTHDGTLVIVARDRDGDVLRLFDAATGDARKTVQVALPRNLPITALKCN